MKSISKSTAQILSERSVISEEDAEICSYGLEIFFSSLLELAVIFLISAFVGNFVPTLLFFASFIPLRLYAGGYHADTKLKCFSVSLVVYAVFSVILTFLPKDLYTTVISAEVVYTLLMVYMAAPVVHPNKSVTSAERKVYRKISLAVAMIESIIILALMFIVKDKIFALSLALGQFGESTSMSAAIIKSNLTDK